MFEILCKCFVYKICLAEMYYGLKAVVCKSKSTMFIKFGLILKLSM